MSLGRIKYSFPKAQVARCVFSGFPEDYSEVLSLQTSKAVECSWNQSLSDPAEASQKWEKQALTGFQDKLSALVLFFVAILLSKLTLLSPHSCVNMVL